MRCNSCSPCSRTAAHRDQCCARPAEEPAVRSVQEGPEEVVSTGNAGTAGVSGDLSLSTETASAGNSGALDFWKWLVCVRVGR
jgi:hypothetical protein